ncbi:MAG: hypothetical protein HYY24_21865 [Verrucomicrobia bacterium]|nr:hypothetical protein [Verrucomicrobiota bacterium]
MKTIPEEVIDETWQHFSELSESEAQALAQQMQEEQPFIMIYLLAADEDATGEEDAGSLMELGAIIWQVMSQGGTRLRQVSGEELEAAEDANMKFLEGLEEGPEMDYLGAVKQMIASYNQMPLLGAVLEALMAGNEDTPELAGENVGLSLLHLKTVIDCLDQ